MSKFKISKYEWKLGFYTSVLSLFIVGVYAPYSWVKLCGSIFFFLYGFYCYTKYKKMEGK